MLSAKMAKTLKVSDFEITKTAQYLVEMGACNQRNAFF